MSYDVTNERAEVFDNSVRLMLAYLCIAAEKESSLEIKVGILSRFGLTNAEMAAVCGSKIQSVKNALHSIRKDGSK